MHLIGKLKVVLLYPECIADSRVQFRCPKSIRTKGAHRSTYVSKAVFSLELLSVNSKVHDNRQPFKSLIMAPDPIITKLLPQLNGLARGNRLEIDEFLADNAMTNLFLLALAAMQKDSLRRTNDGPDWKKYYALGGM